jgi:hypothetical protein
MEPTEKQIQLVKELLSKHSQDDFKDPNIRFQMKRALDKYSDRHTKSDFHKLINKALSTLKRSKRLYGLATQKQISFLQDLRAIYYPNPKKKGKRISKDLRESISVFLNKKTKQKSEASTLIGKALAEQKSI